jgi:2-oxo-4-hydroxy-4-carboxy--5-ureidoimidazoline (OHCU) decarboxylase
LLLLTFLAGAPGWAQDAETESADSDEAAEEQASAADDVTDEEIEELLGLDEEYTELEDDFDPTEEVRYEQSIPFPTDI